MTKHQKRTTLRIGSISSGTLRPEDLVSALISVLEDLRLSRDERKTINEIRRNADGNGDPDYCEGDLSIDYECLCSIADNHVPDYCYYGSTEGDGAEIGVWPSFGSFDDDPDEVFKSAFTPDSQLSYYADQPYWLHVNDHGNATLYRRAGRRWVECWSAV